MTKTITISYDEFEAMRQELNKLKECESSRFTKIISFYGGGVEHVKYVNTEEVLAEARKALEKENRETQTRVIKQRLDELVKEKVAHLECELASVRNDLEYAEGFKPRAEFLTKQLLSLYDRVDDYNNQGCFHRFGNKFYAPRIVMKDN